MKSFSINYGPPPPSEPSELAKRLQARMAELGGFRSAPLWEGIVPYVCTYCGCHVSLTYVEAHRERCQP